MLVVAAIVAMLLAGGGAFLLGMHPGALVQASNDFDAALADARALAVTSGNGATLVFAPRPNGVPGFTLRVYTGRPTSAKSVFTSTSMPLVSDATVSEATLGTPPFAIFLGASGHASGKGGYPNVAAGGHATFPPIASEPPCPHGGFTLTFVGPQHARATRTIPCGVVVALGTAAPNPSPTPNVPIVTPAALTYHWPADAQQSFAATEWGYTHWFAATGFACGSGVATFPNVLPSPFTPAVSAAEASADPKRPAGEPYSFPNSGGGSTNDAPARFPLDPAGEGLCNAVVADDYGQPASVAVTVMGWLTASYGGGSATHLTAPLALPGGTFARAGSSATISLSKRYDAEPLLPAVALDPLCSKYVTFAVASGTTPPSPSPVAATASVTLTATAMPPSEIACAATVFDQYAGSQTGEGVAINATLSAEGPLVAWPAAEEIALQGQSLSPSTSGAPCHARAFADAGFSTPLLRKTELAADGTIVAQTDDTGCILDASKTPITGGAVASQAGMPASRNFAYAPFTCGGNLSFASRWLPDPNGAGPGGDLLIFSGLKGGKCTVDLIGDLTQNPSASPAPLPVSVVYCDSSGGTIPVGGTCTYVLPAGSSSGSCAKGDGGQITIISFFVTLNSGLPTDDSPPSAGSSPFGQLTVNANVATFARTAPGDVVVYIDELQTYIGGLACQEYAHTWSLASSLIYH